MSHKTRMYVLATSIIVIIVGVLFWAYESFLDGSVINPVSTHQMPLAKGDVLTAGKAFIPNNDVLGAWMTTTEKSSYKVNEDIYAYFSICVKRKLTPTVQWMFANDISFPLSVRTGRLLVPGCYVNEKVLIAKVPDEFRNADPGSIYRLYGYVEYQVNPFHEIGYEFVTNTFTISK